MILIEENEEYLENRKLAISDYNKDTIYEAELRAALNSLELSTDNLYMDIDHRICLLQRQQILLMQAMLLNQLEVLRDKEGNTLYSHAAGKLQKFISVRKYWSRQDQVMKSVVKKSRFGLERDLKNLHI